MLQREEFTELVSKAYGNLYDLVALRTHPLVYYLTNDGQNMKERAWQLHHILLEVIEDLDPGQNAPAFSREWRRHRLMHLRFVEAQEIATVKEHLAISRRQFYREQKEAIATAAAILWGRIVADPDEALHAAVNESAGEPPAVVDPEARMELLRQETRRFSQSQKDANAAEVLQGTVELLASVLDDKQLEIEIVQSRQSQVLIDPILLRQIFMGMLSYLVEHSAHASIRIESTTHSGVSEIQMVVVPPQNLAIPSRVDVKLKMNAYDEIARLNGGRVRPVLLADRIHGLVVELPEYQAKTVLVIDDNEDMLSFYARILTNNHYHLLMASSGTTALQMIEQQTPDYIFLDLMIPDQDGWDMLSILRSNPATSRVPIIICSVLKQRELALSLGASGYLEKPITEDMLLLLLQTL